MQSISPETGGEEGMVCFSSAKGIGKTENRDFKSLLSPLLRTGDDEILPGFFGSNQFLEELVVQGMARLLDHKVADHRATQYCQIPDEIKNLVPHKFVLVPQSIFVEDPESSITMALFQGTAKSQAVFPQSLNVLRKPKVLALLISLIKSFPEKLRSKAWSLRRGWLKSMAKEIFRLLERLMRTERPPSWISSGPLDHHERFGLFCSRMPAERSRKMNGAALPSMMGTSGPSNSTRALSIPSRRRLP